MSKLSKRQNGFSAVEVIILLVVLGLIGFVAMRVLDSNDADTNDGTTQIEEAADLEPA